MVPTLDKEELRDRMRGKAMSDENKPTTIENILRKRKNVGEPSAAIRYKRRMGQQLKSKIQPKTGLENINA